MSKPQKLKFVVYEGKKFRVKGKSLNLQRNNINNFIVIHGIDKLWYLKRLNLSHNNISNMDGIQNLQNLRILKLSDNKIQKIENVKNLQKLKKLVLDNNEIKKFDEADLPPKLIHIDIAKNPIEKFRIFTKDIYQVIHFGPKNWFPEEEIKRLKEQMRRLSSYKGYGTKGDSIKFLVIFIIWALLTFCLALVINIPFWVVVISRLGRNYWETLFGVGLWTFLVGGIGAVVIMSIFYEEVL